MVPIPAAPGAGAVPTHPLDREVALLGHAQSLLDDDPAGALAQLEQHAAESPRGEMATEREFLAVRALLRLGRRAEAAARADAGVDAGLSFPCGELRCDPGTQFCRGVSSSAATRRITYSCEALPTACGGAANCACVVPRETAGAACQEYSDGAVHVSLYTP